MLKLNDPALLETRAYVNGQWITGASTFSVCNPANGSKLADVSDLGVEDVKRARRDAPSAFYDELSHLAGAD